MPGSFSLEPKDRAEGVAVEMLERPIQASLLKEGEKGKISKIIGGRDAQGEVRRDKHSRG